MAIKPRRIKPNTTVDYLGSWTVLNETGADIEKNKLVAISGVNSNGAFMIVELLGAGADSRVKFVTGQKIPKGSSGVVRAAAILSNVNTAAGAVGDAVNAAASGGWQIGGGSEQVGQILKADATTGSVPLFPQGVS